MNAATIYPIAEPAPTVSARPTQPSRPMNAKSHWFRFYSRMIDSPQVLELSDAEFRLIVSLWCVASEQPERGSIPMTLRAIRRRAVPDHSEEECRQYVSRLIELGLIIGDDGAYQVPRWDEHQYEYPSRTPEARAEQKRGNDNKNSGGKRRGSGGKKRGSDCAVNAKSRGTVGNTDTDTEGDTETESEGGNTKSVEPAGGGSPQGDVMTIPLNTGDEYPVAAETIAEFAASYPAVDVAQELRAMRAWCLANPTRRKTRTGVLKFINSWLSRKQDRPTIAAASKPADLPSAPTIADAWWVWSYETAADRAAKEGVADHHHRWAKLRGTDGKLWFCKPENLSRGMPAGFAPWGDA